MTHVQCSPAATPAARGTRSHRGEGLTRACLLTVSEAVRALRMRDRDARLWLHRHGLVLDVEGRRRVLWGAVLDTLTGETTAPPPKPAVRPRLRRSGLLGGV